MSSLFNQPFIINKPFTFVEETRQYFNDYISFTDKIINSLSLEKENENLCREGIKKNTEGIFDCLVNYQNGHKIKCAEIFQDLMFENLEYLKKNIHRSQSVKKSNQIFYRIRRGIISSQEKKDTPNHTLFHLPFNLRHYVGTGRFNSSGIPILYLSDSLKIPYFECNYPKTSFCDDSNSDNTINIGLFRNAKSFRFFDFSFVPWEELLDRHNEVKIESPLTNYMVLFPIIAAIHLKINFHNDVSFRFDYVFSTLIMDFVKDLEINNLFETTGLMLPIFALKYSSVKLFMEQDSIDKNSECFKNHNYAFLTKYYENSQHCLNLESIFLNNGANKVMYSDNSFFKKFKNKRITDTEILTIEEELRRTLSL